MRFASMRFAVAAAAVRGADFALVVIDGVVDGLRLGPGRGGVVEVDAWRGHDRSIIGDWRRIVVGTLRVP